MKNLLVKNISLSGWLFAFFLFILPFVTSRDLFYASMNLKSFFVLGAVSIFALIFSYKLWKGEVSFNYFKSPIFVILGLFLISLYISAFTGVFTEVSLWSQILRGSGVFYITYISLLAVFLGTMLNIHDWKFARRSIALSGSIFSLFYFLGTQGLMIGGKFLSVDFEINGLSFGNETFAGAYILLSLIITIFEYKDSFGKVKKWILGAILLQTFNPLFVNFSVWNGTTNIFQDPSGIIGSAQASAITMYAMYVYLLGDWLVGKIKTDRVKRNIKRIYSGLWLVGIVTGIALLFSSGSIVQRFYSQESTGARLLVWEGAEEAIKEKPFFGWGNENFQVSYQKYFDNRLFQQEYVGEIWFDRAHNFFIDTLVSTGYIGLIFYMALFVGMVYLFEKARRKGHISNNEMAILGVFLGAYIVQLQTSFETVSIYVLLSFALGYAIFLSKIDKQSNAKDNANMRKVIALVLVCLTIFGSTKLIFAEHKRQSALVSIFRIKSDNFEKRAELVNIGLSRISSYESIRTASSGFFGGVLNKISDGTGNQIVVEKSLVELSLYEKYYIDYIEASPMDYRARMQISYLYMIKTILGEPSTEKARVYIEEGYVLSPSNPLAYVMESLSYLYEGNIKKAKELANKAIALNPDIELSRKTLEHIEKQEKTFPVISFMKLQNL